ncbi:flavodoxin [Parabacteroides sp. TM07-1AC]|jgi:flavodoxin|uniref:flavodoxin n=1 Tax=Parabacteroides sp. TM07-1AC TaxID=2292363 RepID=UPI000EFE6521|nr:flavodoxin [Parabacteroides sp. TM07-1AC]RHU28992.1 flavodoxin [Parabacteroides sp. TM07-1AC]
MKNIISILMMLCACAFTAHAQGNTSQTTDMKNSKKVLVVFFSRTGENYAVGNIEKGNTHIIAEMIAKETGGKLFRIETVKPYPDEYKACVEVAKAEKESNARPEIKGDVKVEDYDIIFLGYPNWWGDMPMAVYTFIEKHNWNGKTVVPFCTHEGSGLSDTERKLKDACKGATVSAGLAIKGTTAQNSQPQTLKTVQTWLLK